MKDKNYYKGMFSERLNQLIGDKGVAEFAGQLGLSRSTVDAWLKKQSTPRAMHLIMLAKKFDVSIDFLVGEEERHFTLPSPI